MTQVDHELSPDSAVDRSGSLDAFVMSQTFDSPRRSSKRLSRQPTLSTSDVETARPARKRKFMASADSRQDKHLRSIGTISPNALRDLTTRNTRRNDGYSFSVLDVKVVFRDGPRPPSPTSRIRTVTEKQTEEAEQTRNARARKRRLIRGINDEKGGNTPSVPAIMPSTPRPEKHPRAPGDDDDYHTPKRIRFAARDDVAVCEPDDGDMHRASQEREGCSSASNLVKRKFVHWDKLLANDAEVPRPLSVESEEAEGRCRSALRTAQVSYYCAVLPGNGAHIGLAS